MIYFDAGATTLEKPAAVGWAMAQATHAMSSPGRGSYPASRRAEETAYLCRQEAAELLGVPQPENVIITTSATHGLNIAIRSLLGSGDRVVISGYEHNAVTRPLHAIPGLSVTVIDTPLFRPDLAAEEFRRAIRQLRPRAVVCTHVSNVFGMILPVADIAETCRETETPLIVDASQSAGVLPVDLSGWGAAFVALPGHKDCTAPRARGCCCAEGRGQSPCCMAEPAACPACRICPRTCRIDWRPGPQHAGHRRAAGGHPVRAAAGSGRHRRPGASGGAAGCPGAGAAAGGADILGPGASASDRRCILCNGGTELRGGGGGSGPAGNCSAGGAPLCAFGPPDGGDAGNRNPAAEHVVFQYAGPGGSPGMVRVPGAS